MAAISQHVKDSGSKCICRYIGFHSCFFMDAMASDGVTTQQIAGSCPSRIHVVLLAHRSSIAKYIWPACRTSLFAITSASHLRRRCLLLHLWLVALRKAARHRPLHRFWSSSGGILHIPDQLYVRTHLLMLFAAARGPYPVAQIA